ncbi:MAG TPA: TonB-dependent receptor, partial [Steroidobacteraceae bacterium]|nr:TonB-dependent receptor [Steroidobacteraceae bacterium]
MSLLGQRATVIGHVGTILALSLWAAMVPAQQTNEAVGETAAPSTGLAEIVVTATRRGTAVQNTPISLTAFTSDDIAAQGLADLNGLVQSTPGLAIRDMGGPSMDEFEIRGLNSQGGNSSMVGEYIDEIPLATATGSQFGKGSFNPDLYDLARVEVLRGPQGTLYGSSSMGGTIRLIPHDPELHTFTGSAEEVVSDTISGGDINHHENAMVNLPLGDTAALRIVGSFADDSGWVQRRVIQDGAIAVDAGAFPYVTRPSNFYTAPLQEEVSGANTSNSHSIRASLLWQPTDNLTIQPTALYEYDQLAAPPSVDVNGYPTHPTTPSVWAHYEPFDSPEPQTNSLSFGSLKAVYRLPEASITSATGYFNRSFVSLEDTAEGFDAALVLPAYDASAGGIGNSVSTRGPGLLEQDSTRQLSQELRINSTTPLSLPGDLGGLDYVFGYFYQDLHSNDFLDTFAQQGEAILHGPYLYVESQPETIIQNAVYGNLNWRISPEFEWQAGFRHYHYSLGAHSEEYGAFSAGAPCGNSCPYFSTASISATGTIPSTTFTFHIDPNHMVYATIAKGFRLGGVSGDAGPTPVVPASNTNPLFASSVANECAVQAKVLLTTTCN